MPTLLITGANRGLGLEFVRQYTAEGWDVIACCRDPKKAADLQSIKNVKVEALDVSDAASIKSLAAKLKGTAIDLLINNAGIFSGNSNTNSANKSDPGQEFGSIDAEGWDKVLRINSIAPIMIMEAFAANLEKAKHPKAINITSRMGSIEDTSSGYLAYRSSKAALNMAMRSILPDLTAKNIAVANLHPGWVRTDMGGPSATLDAETSISGMRKVIAKLTLKETGVFIGYDGKVIPW